MNKRLPKFLIICITYFCILFGNFGYSICFHEADSFHLTLGGHEDEPCEQARCPEEERAERTTSFSNEACDQHCLDISFEQSQYTVSTTRSNKIIPPLFQRISTSTFQKDYNRLHFSKAPIEGPVSKSEKDYILNSILRI